jgi:hypothetical protein
LRENVLRKKQVYLRKPEKFVYFTLKMAELGSIETSGTKRQTTRRHISEGLILQHCHCEQLKSRKSVSPVTVVYNG